MPLVTNESLRDDISESEPILRQPDDLEVSEVSSSSASSEIISAGGDFTVVVDDLQNLDADETCNLVNPEQAQCRICLDNEGLEPVLARFVYCSNIFYGFVFMS